MRCRGYLPYWEMVRWNGEGFAGGEIYSGSISFHHLIIVDGLQLLTTSNLVDLEEFIMLGKRLVSTFRSLQHENPLVLLISFEILGISVLIRYSGPPSLRHAAVSPKSSRAAREAQDPRCEEGDCCVFGEGWGGEVDNSGYASILPCSITQILNYMGTINSQPRSRLRPPRHPHRHPRHRHLRPINSYSVEPIRRA